MYLYPSLLEKNCTIYYIFANFMIIRGKNFIIQKFILKQKNEEALF